ncbi:MAG: GNAT family N-acetyltransferase [Gemmatimonadaceae bacterium]|nr:GNAT family N-acetyltransferase [Gemmatimonadaceae bacterium]
MRSGLTNDSGLEIRSATPDDDAALRALNNAAVPHVNVLDEEQFAWIRGNADFAVLALRDGRVDGFALALRNGTPYWSGNYAWFGERYDSFLYLDRIVVAPRAKRAGVGRALYAAMFAFARGRWARIALEVNVRPPNPDSIAFHEAMGFVRVGARSYDGGEVAMFERPV